MSTLPITVIIPAYNRAHCIERALDSVHAQSALPAEVIVIDDKSTDNTVELASKYPCTVLRQTHNGGPAQARNAGIQAATQPWIALLDSDDEWTPNHLAQLWEHHKGFRFMSSSAVSLDGDGNPRWLRGNPRDEVLVLQSPAETVLPLNPIVTSSVVIERELVLAHGGFRDLRQAEDLDLWVRVVQDTPIAIIPDVTVRYHHGDDQASGTAASMHSSVMTVLADRSHEDWYSKRVPRSVESVHYWDSSKSQLRSRNIAEGCRSLFHVLRRPSTWTVLFRLHNNRAQLRQRSHRLTTT